MLLEMTDDDGDRKAIQRPWERVAQPVEHVTFNHGVLGSSPSALTIDVVRLIKFCLQDIKTNRGTAG